MEQLKEMNKEHAGFTATQTDNGFHVTYFDSSHEVRGGPASLDSFAAKLSYNWLVDVMPLVSHILGYASEYEKDYKPHPVFVH